MILPMSIRTSGWEFGSPAPVCSHGEAASAKLLHDVSIQLRSWCRELTCMPGSIVVVRKLHASSLRHIVLPSIPARQLKMSIHSEK